MLLLYNNGVSPTLVGEGRLLKIKNSKKGFELMTLVLSRLRNYMRTTFRVIIIVKNNIFSLIIV